MNLTDEELKRVWIKRYGNQAWVKDCYGCWIYFYDRGRDCPARKNPDGVVEPCGWEIDHIYPESRGGSNNEYNIEFVYGKFSEMKSDKLQYTLTNSIVFKVIKRPCKPGYGIYNTNGNCFIDWVSKN